MNRMNTALQVEAVATDRSTFGPPRVRVQAASEVPNDGVKAVEFVCNQEAQPKIGDWVQVNVEWGSD